MNGDVVDVIDAQETSSVYYGVVASSENNVSSSSTSSSGTSIVTKVACTDDMVRTFYHSGSTQSTGKLVSVSTAQNGTTVKSLSSKKLEGSVNASGTKLGSYAIADDVEILDTDSNGGYARIYPSRLAGTKLSGSDVAFYSLNENDEIDRLILKDVTGDIADYVYITSSNDMSGDTSISVSYSYYKDGQINTLSGSALYSVKVGGAALYYDDDGSIKSMCQMTSVTLTELSNLTAVAGNKKYAIDKDAQVILRSSGSSGYYAAMFSAINASDYSLTGWYDNLGYSAGGRIRLIVATEK